MSLDALIALRVIQEGLSGGATFVPAPGAARPLAPDARRAPVARQAASGAPLLYGAGAVSVLLTCRALRRQAVGRPRKLKVLRRLVKERREIGEVEDAKTMAERLQMEAAKLRADVEELEAIGREEERRRREALFRSWDLDSSGTLDKEELKLGVSQECQVDLDDTKARRLLEALDENGDGVLQNEEFSLQRVEKTLREFQKEERAIEEEALAKKREQREQEEQEREKEEYLASLPERNEDDSLPTRLLAAVAYLLPVLDAAERFGWPLATMNPEFFQLLNVPMSLLSAVPFGLGFLLVFIGMQAVAGNPENPALVRYNMRQAIQLDIMLFVPIILGGLGKWAQSYWEVDLPGFSILSSCAVFALMLLLCTYAATCALTGNYARGIPYASDMAELTLSDTRSKDSEDAK